MEGRSTEKNSYSFLIHITFKRMSGAFFSYNFIKMICFLEGKRKGLGMGEGRMPLQISHIINLAILKPKE